MAQRGYAARRGICAVLLLALGWLAGCGSTAADDHDPGGSQPGAVAIPSVKPSTPVLDARLPAVPLVALPVSGKAHWQGTRHNLQCVDLHWRTGKHAVALPEGVTVTVTAASFDRYVFRLSPAGCERRGPSCLGFTFDAATTAVRCSQAVRTRRPVTAGLDDRRIGLTGRVSCPMTLGTTRCGRVVDAALNARHTVRLPTPPRHRTTPTWAPRRGWMSAAAAGRGNR